MSIHRQAAKRDANEPEIIAALKAAGCSVQQLSGKGIPDLLVGMTEYYELTCPDGTVNFDRRIVNLLMEVKAPKAKLTEDQATWHSEWRGQVVIVRSIEDALAAVSRI